MRNRQRGVFLIGASIAVAIVGLLMTIWIQHQAQQARIEKGERVGAALRVIGEGVEAMLVEHHDALSKAFDGHPVVLTNPTDANVVLPIRIVGTGTGAVAHVQPLGAQAPREITAADVAHLMKLPGVGGRPPLAGAHYRIKIQASQATTTGTRNIEALVYLDQPIASTYGRNYDATASSAALRKMGPHGGITLPDNPAILRFPNTPRNPSDPAPDVGNPMPGRVGILAMRAGYLASGFDKFVRRDGSRAMTGTLQVTNGIKGQGNIETDDDMRAKQLIAGRSLVVGNSATHAGLVTLHGGSGKTDAQLIVSGKTTTDSLSVTGAASAGTIDARHMNVSESLHAKTLKAGDVALDGGTVRFHQSITPGGYCAHDPAQKGQLAVDGSGMAYVCQSNKWQSLKGESGRDGRNGWNGADGKDGKSWGEKRTITNYATNCTPTNFKTPWKHHMCVITKVDNSQCRNQYGPNATVTPVPDTGQAGQKGSQPYDGNENYAADWYSLTGSLYYQITTKEAQVHVACYDFF